MSSFPPAPTEAPGFQPPPPPRGQTSAAALGVEPPPPLVQPTQLPWRPPVTNTSNIASKRATAVAPCSRRRAVCRRHQEELRPPGPSPLPPLALDPSHPPPSTTSTTSPPSTSQRRRPRLEPGTPSWSNSLQLQIRFPDATDQGLLV
jgi:hypothetical protein